MSFSILDLLGEQEADGYFVNARPWGQKRTDEERKKQHFVQTGGLAQKRLKQLKKWRERNAGTCNN